MPPAQLRTCTVTALPATRLRHGVQVPDVAAAERAAIVEFNKQPRAPRVRLIRRTRSILHKYGQYLDLIMLLNGHRHPIIYPESQPKDPSGEIFEPCPDVDYFCGADFEYLVIMDRDNVLGPRFFSVATGVIQRAPDAEIIQPEIRPFPNKFRRALEGGESGYAAAAALFQKLGNDVLKLRQRHVPVACFFGKGVLRRCAAAAVAATAAAVCWGRRCLCHPSRPRSPMHARRQCLRFHTVCLCSAQ